MFIKNPFVIFFFPFAFGILAGYYLHISTPFLLLPILLLTIIILQYNFFRKFPKLFGLFAYIFLFVLGIYIFNLHKHTPPKQYSKQKSIYQGIIIEPIIQKNKYFKTIIKIEAKKDSLNWQKFETKAIAYFKKNSNFHLHYGDMIIFKSELKKINNNGNPYEFDYKKFMNNKGIFFIAFINKNRYKILAHNKAPGIKQFALNIRQKLINIYKKHHIKGQAFAILSALTLGYRDALNADTKQMFANTGAMHILAVSGLHVGIIYIILLNLLAFMNKNQSLMILKSIIIIISLWIFALIAGMSASVTRSALMFSLFVIGRLLMKTSSLYNIIFATAFLILLFKPYSIFSVGFQLSYAAVLAIIFFQPIIYQIFTLKSFIADKIWALTTVSIAAQIGTMPIGLFYFHQFPNYFFLTNIIVIPLASLILYTALLLFAISFIPVLSSAIAFILKILLKILINSIYFINSIPFATSKNIYISVLQTILLFITILSIAIFFSYKKKFTLYLSSFTIIFFLLLNINAKLKKNTNYNNLIIFNSRGNLLIDIIANKNYIIANKNLLQNKKKLNYLLTPFLQAKKISSKTQIYMDIDSIQNTKIENNILMCKNNFIQIGNTKFLILRTGDITNYSTNKKIKIDYLVLSDNIYISIKKLKNYFDFKKIIFDSSNKYYRTEKWKKECYENKIQYIDITTQGAWALDYKTKQELTKI